METTFDVDYEAVQKCGCKNKYGFACDCEKWLVFTKFEIGGVDFLNIVQDIELYCSPEYLDEYQDDIMKAIKKEMLK